MEEFTKNVKICNGYLFVGVLCFIVPLFQLSCKSYFKNVKVENDFNYYKKEGIPIEPGKCFAQSAFIDHYTYHEEIVAVYTGDEFEAKELKFRKYLAKPIRTKWIWTSPSYLDGSKNPEDVHFWAFNREQAYFGEFYEVIDTNVIKDYQFEKIREYKLEKENYKDWIEVVCDNDITNEFIIRIKKSLSINGYGQKLKIDSKITEEMYKALAYFQTNNSLPIGNLDFKTLELLGVEY